MERFAKVIVGLYKGKLEIEDTTVEHLPGPEDPTHVRFDGTPGPLTINYYEVEYITEYK